MSEVKWIKITTDMFDNRKIRYIRTLPEGNNIVLIWVMMLTMAGRCNSNGMIFLTENIPYTVEMLSSSLGFDINTVRLAIMTLEKLGMISTEDSCFLINNWSEYQSVEGLDKIREQTRNRVKNYRDKRKIECNVTSNVTVTDSSISYSLSNSNSSSNSLSTSYSSSINNIIDYLNNKLGTKYRSTTQKTASLIKARLKEKFTEDDFFKVIDSKCNEWLGTDMAKFLRPETLFGTKFEGYLNQINNESNTHKNNNGGIIDWDNV